MAILQSLDFWLFSLQYPLKEVVVIHKDQSALNDIMTLENYVMEVGT